MAKLLDINWNKFRINNPNCTEAFERMCYHIFCRIYKVENGIKADFNHAGLETDPICFGRKWYGFQSKFFDYAIDYGQIKKSVEIAIDGRNTNLNEIIVFVNVGINSKSKAATDIEAVAKKNGVKIQWFTQSKFVETLNKPENGDLAQLFFGQGDHYGFIQSNVASEKNDLINSATFVNLTITDSYGHPCDILKTLRESTSKVHLLAGSPGSGKSVLHYWLFYQLAGFATSSRQEQHEWIIQQNALPMPIYLKDCILNGALERIIRERKKDYKIGNGVKLIYLMDGLDEIPYDRVDLIFDRIKAISEDVDTKCILLTCRSANANRYRLHDYCENAKDYRIQNLSKKDIQSYFTAKGDQQKTALLTNLTSSSWLDDIHDALLLKILWQNIHSITPSTPPIFLIERKIESLLLHKEHISYKGSLDLLNPIQNQLIIFNQKIAEELYISGRLRISLSQLQQIAQSIFPKLDYSGINKVITHVADCFFEQRTSAVDSSYAYAHRRYLEYFTVQFLKSKFEKDATILRKLNILADKDLFKGCFLPYIQKKSNENKNVIGGLTYSLIQVYLGNHNGWGADSPSHYSSQYLYPAIFSRADVDIQSLIENESYDIKFLFEFDKDQIVHLLGKPEELTEMEFKVLHTFWTRTRINFIKASVQLIRKNIFKHWILSTTDEMLKLFRFSKWIRIYSEHAQRSSDQHIKDPLENVLPDFFLIRIVYEGLDVVDYYTNRIRNSYNNKPKEIENRHSESQEVNVFRAYFSACLEKGIAEALRLLPHLEAWEHNIALNELTKLESISLLFQNPASIATIKKWFVDFDWTDYHRFPARIFIENEVMESISSESQEYLRQRIQELRNTRHIDRQLYNLDWDMVLLCAVGDDYSFEFWENSISSDRSFRYRYDLGLYTSLGRAYIDCLKKSKSIQQVLGPYIRCNRFYNEKTGEPDLNWKSSKIWGYILAVCSESAMELKNSIQILKNSDSFISAGLLDVFATMHSVKFHLDYGSLRQLTIEDSHGIYYSEKVDWDFQKSILWYSLDKMKSNEYFKSAMQQSVLRHGFRKDGLVTRLLPEALGLYLKNADLSNKQQDLACDLVLDLCTFVAKFSERAGYGPDELIKVLADHDVDYASTLYSRWNAKQSDTFGNSAITAIAIAKIHRLHSFQSIFELFDSYETSYDHKHKERPAVNIERLRIVVEFLEFNGHTLADRQEAIKKGSHLAQRLSGISAYELHGDDVVERWNQFCTVFENTEYMISVSSDPGDSYMGEQPHDENKLMKVLVNTKNVKQLKRCFRHLTRSKDRIAIGRQASWDLIVQHSLLVGDHKLESMLWFMNENNYPHMDFWSSSSKTMYKGIASGLKKNRTQFSIMDHLIANGGRGGFLEAIKAYDVIGDRAMVEKLYLRFFNMCELLVK